MSVLPLGKLPLKLLEKYVLRLTGVSSEKIVTKPEVGLDFAAIETDSGYLIISTDPITGAKESIGEYAVNISCNDVATSGNRPRFIANVILLPNNAKTDYLKSISMQIHKAATRLGISIIGGHTEVTPNLDRTIVITTALALANRYVSSKDAMEGDAIIVTKSVGLEGTAILANEAKRVLQKLPERLLKRAKKFTDLISIVKEAEVAFRTGHVHAMHDCTEGGLVGAVYEMSLASGLGFELYEKDIPVAEETRRICSFLGLDPLKLISSGSLIIAAEYGKESTVVEKLKRIGINAKVVGRFVRGSRKLIHLDGAEESVNDAPTDELWKFLSK